MNQLSDRLRGLLQSDIRRMSRECERVGGINLGQGICDLPTIPELVEGACDAIRGSKATYSKFEGIDLLRERIARKIEHFNGFRVDPATDIVVTIGATGGFATAVLATLNHSLRTLSASATLFGGTVINTSEPFPPPVGR